MPLTNITGKKAFKRATHKSTRRALFEHLLAANSPEKTLRDTYEAVAPDQAYDTFKALIDHLIERNVIVPAAPDNIMRPSVILSDEYRIPVADYIQGLELLKNPTNAQTYRDSGRQLLQEPSTMDRLMQME